MDSIKILERAGLTKSEAKIYLALLDLGPCLAGKISRKTGIHRRNVYDATERLISKGVISYILKNNRRTFKAVHPERFMEIIKDHEFAISSILPELSSKFNNFVQNEGVEFYSGKQGLKTTFEDQIREGKEILIYGASLTAYEFMKYYFMWYDKKRINKKIPIKIIFPLSCKKKIKNLSLSKIKYLPDEYIGEAAYNVYSDTISIILWNKKNPLSIVIKDKKIAESYKRNFELAWKIAK
jgi:sugar-specific transcriptional regulator TrmB